MNAEPIFNLQCSAQTPEELTLIANAFTPLLKYSNACLIGSVERN